MQTAEFANRNGLEGCKFERAIPNHLLEFSNGDLVEAAAHFTEPGGAFRPEIGAPTEQGLFAEQKMGPGKYRK